LEFKHRHLLGIDDLKASEIMAVLETAESMAEISAREIKKVPTLRGKTVVNMFFEPSTRTRSSFEIAAKRLSADILNFSQQTSSVVKGESLKDTIQTIEAMAPDALVIRHGSSGAPHYVTTFCKSHVVNAGDGSHEHPTQALLDAFTIRQKHKSFRDLRVVIVGDILHSRVARSNILCLKKLGASVALAGVPTLLPREFGDLGADVYHDFDEALAGADVIMMLRIQLERMQRNFFPSIREYRNLFCLTRRRFNRAKKNAIVMHPGPMNRGVEIDDEMADAPESVILHQVENGISVRMAVLYLLLGGKDREITA